MIKKIIRFFLNKLPIKNVILFESAPDLSDNTKPVFDEMVKRGINDKYKMIWMCRDKVLSSYPKIKNVKYLEVRKHKIHASLLNHTAKFVICCNLFLGCSRSNQKIFYICHGSPFKNTSSYYAPPNFYNYIITASDYFAKLQADQFHFPLEKIFGLGFPRNDDLLNTEINLKSIFGDYKKFIVWYPTVKTFKSGRKTGCIQPIQFLNLKEEAYKINEEAKKHDILIIIKPHFAQIEDINKKEFSNIVYIDDAFFKEKNISSYSFVGACDALLTDYSSIYCDYLLCNKPIGLIWQDIDEFLSNPGLVREYKYIAGGGEKIYSSDDLCAFISRISSNKDLLKLERNELITNLYSLQEKQSTKRVTEFIISKSKI